VSYVSLARKYRPRRFIDMVGQESTTLALTNAIRLRREPHSVIFTGVRGVGKTTSARIYAKALNCENGPTAEPCDVCASCMAIVAGNHEDVLEIDGASNTGVDDVRALQETLSYVPQRSTYKIYIIDEVHMLSISAFNALLKTLEEPPQHVVFIFATTELHKVPETIQSRCQTFHLQKISRPVIIERLRSILTAEEIPFDEAALAIVAREGRGSMRDALTMLDQSIAVGGGQVSLDALRNMVGSSSQALPILELLDGLLRKDAGQILEVIARWDQEGLAMSSLAEETAKACRNAFILRDLKGQAIDLQLLELEDREQQMLLELGEKAAPMDLNRLFRQLAKCLDDLRHADLDRFVLENYCLEWCFDPGLPDLQTLMNIISSGQPLPQAALRGPTQTAAAGDGPAINLRERWKTAAPSPSGARPTTAPQATAPKPSPNSAANPMTAPTAKSNPAPLGHASTPQAQLEKSSALQPLAADVKQPKPETQTQGKPQLSPLAQRLAMTHASPASDHTQAATTPQPSLRPPLPGLAQPVMAQALARSAEPVMAEPAITKSVQSRSTVNEDLDAHAQLTADQPAIQDQAEVIQSAMAQPSMRESQVATNQPTMTQPNMHESHASANQHAMAQPSMHESQVATNQPTMTQPNLHEGQASANQHAMAQPSMHESQASTNQHAMGQPTPHESQASTNQHAMARPTPHESQASTNQHAMGQPTPHESQTSTNQHAMARPTPHESQTSTTQAAMTQTAMRSTEGHPVITPPVVAQPEAKQPSLNQTFMRTAEGQLPWTQPAIAKPLQVEQPLVKVQTANQTQPSSTPIPVPPPAANPMNTGTKDQGRTGALAQTKGPATAPDPVPPFDLADDEMPPWVLHEEASRQGAVTAPQDEPIAHELPKNEGFLKQMARKATSGVTPPTPPPPVETPAAAAPAALHEPLWPANWRTFVDEWKKQKPLQGRVLEEAYVIEYSPQRIRLAVEPTSMAGGKLLQQDVRKRLMEQFTQLFGFKGVLEAVPKADANPGKTGTNSQAPDLGETLLEVKSREREVAREQLRHRLEEHPMTREVISRFGGTIEQIELQ